MIDRRTVAGHLRLFESLGVQGVSRDASWRQRDGDSSPLPVVMPPQPDVPRESAPASMTDPGSALKALRDEIGDCTRCVLHSQGRKQVVFGVGNPAAQLMFVGEAPGADEDIQGEPFVGRAGQLLTKI